MVEYMSTTSTSRWVRYWVNEYNKAAHVGDYARCAYARERRVHHEGTA